MLPTYRREDLIKVKTDDAARVIYESGYKTGLDWNMYIGRIIIRDFIYTLSNYDGMDFDLYIKDVVPYIELGLFQSAIVKVQNIEISGLESQKAWLIKSLEEGEDRPEWRKE